MWWLYVQTVKIQNEIILIIIISFLSFDLYGGPTVLMLWLCACLVCTELLWNCVVWCDVLAREYKGFEL